jgi:hypothetical protein
MKYSAFSALSDMYTDQKAKKLRDFEKNIFFRKKNRPAESRTA